MSKNDDKIKALLNKVETQQKDLGTKPKAAWQTNGIFKYPDGRFFNLNTTQDTQTLVEALAILLEKQSCKKQAAERLGVSSKEFVWDNYPISDWEQDFKKRIEIINWNDKKNQLDETKKKLNCLVSEEAKTEMELADIENQLK